MKGFRINPDTEYVKKIINGLEKKNGHWQIPIDAQCPKKIKT